MLVLVLVLVEVTEEDNERGAEFLDFLKFLSDAAVGFEPDTTPGGNLAFVILDGLGKEGKMDGLEPGVGPGTDACKIDGLEPRVGPGTEEWFGIFIFDVNVGFNADNAGP